MRDVTDNRTGELAVGEIKRGRGRPPKPNAMSNAERQRAYRARRRANVVTVTKSSFARVDQIDAYDECRLEVEALRAELAEAHETINELNADLVDARASVDGLLSAVDRKHRALLKAETERDEILGWGFDAIELKELAKVVRAKKRATAKTSSSASAE